MIFLVTYTPIGPIIVKLKKVYTEKTNGLAHEWIADSVFMNHPYSNSKEWVPYAVSQYELGHAKEMILLINLHKIKDIKSRRLKLSYIGQIL